MRMQAGDINVYWQHEELTATTIRAASYGTSHDSGTLVPEMGDVIRDFHGYMGEPITVRVISVDMIGRGVIAYLVTVATVKP